MLSRSGIEYLSHVWNIAVGCNGTCAYCWARNRWAPRQVRHCAMCAEYLPHLHVYRLGDVTPRQKPKRIGLGFFADIFGPWRWQYWHTRLSDCGTSMLVQLLMGSIGECPQHQFFTLTRHPENIPQGSDWPDNWWIGVTVTNQEEADRLIPALLASGVRHPWVSYEPARGPMDFGSIEILKYTREPNSKDGYAQYRVDCTVCKKLVRKGGFGNAAGARYDMVNGGKADDEHMRQHRLAWVVAGGMTGKDAVPSHPDWFRKVRDDCVAAGVPFYFKQWGEWLPLNQRQDWGTEPIPAARTYQWPGMVSYRVGRKHTGHLLDGREWRQMPGGCDGG